MIRVALLLFALAVAVPPKPAHYVTDAAGVIDDAREQALNERLAQLHRESTAQILVYVDRKLPPNTTIEELGAEAIRQWAPGTAEKDNGAILFVFIDDRESRIETGYGLEEKLTDAKSKRILVEIMRPPLRAGDYAKAVEDGANAIADVALGRELPEPPPSDATASQQPAASNVTSSDGTSFVLATMVLIVIVFFLIGRSGRRGGSGSSGWSSDSSSSDSDSWSSSDSSSSSSSSYDSGGGSGGGGGASDKW